MKRIKLLTIFVSFLAVFNLCVPVSAESPNTLCFENELEDCICTSSEDLISPLAEVECTYYNGKHVMFPLGPCNVYNSSGSTVRYRGWGLYKCNCGSVVICQGFPPSGSISHYFETIYSSVGYVGSIYIYYTDSTPFYTTSTSLPTTIFRAN